MGTKHITKEFLEKTIRVWQPHYEKPLTEDDARKIIINMTRFFDLLGKVAAKSVK